VSPRLEELVLALGERKVIALLRAGAKAHGAPMTAAERSLLGLGVEPVGAKR
jgi:hypothetical protein